MLQAADAVEQGRLAGAVGTDDPDDVAFRDLERHAVDRGDATETFRDITQLELWCGGGAHSDVSRSDRRRYERLNRLRPPKKSITPRGMKITTTTSSTPRITCATIGRASVETNGISKEMGRLPPRNWIIWTLYSIGNALSWLMKTFHWEKIPPARPVRAAASAKAETLYAVVLTPMTDAASSFSRIAIKP